MDTFLIKTLLICLFTEHVITPALVLFYFFIFFTLEFVGICFIRFFSFKYICTVLKFMKARVHENAKAIYFFYIPILLLF